jgi:hypothetical protein
LNHFVRNRLRVIEQVEAGQRCDLVVAAAACAELATEVAAEKLYESAFEGGVNILVRFKWSERTVGHGGGQFVEAGVHLLGLVGG